MKYTTPKVVDYGDIRRITAGQTAHTYDDAVHHTGDQAIQNTSGPCISYAGTTLKCS